MTQRYRKASAESRAAERERQAMERYRRELREDVLREMKTLTGQWMKQFEREFSQSLNDAMRSGRSASQAGDSSGLGGIGTAFANLAFNLLTSSRNRTKTRTETSAGTETARSQEENSFYRQSVAQLDAAAGQAVSRSQRSL